MKCYILNIWDSNEYGESYNYLLKVSSEFISFIKELRNTYFDAIKNFDDIYQDHASCKIRVPHRFLIDILLIKNNDLYNIDLENDINIIPLSKFKELSVVTDTYNEDYYNYLIIYQDRFFIETLLDNQILVSYDIEEVLIEN